MRNQIGVIFKQADNFNHFRNILDLLDPASFEIVIAGERDRLEAVLAQHGYQGSWYEDILPEAIEQEPRYRYTLSHHYITGFDLHRDDGTLERKVYLPQLLGQTNIRMTYSMGKDYWVYADWNRIFAIQLCYGPWHAERFKRCFSRFGMQVHQIGYPRYDDFFNLPFDREALCAALGCDPAKKTLVWLPTRYQHTLRAFGETVAGLSDRYNVLVKLHPLSWDEEPGLIDWLRQLPLTRLIRDTDHLELMRLADHVLCDYGGAAFGALYTDRDILLFNHPARTRFEPDQLHVDPDGPTRLEELNQTELYLRRFLPNLNPDQQQQLPELLTDTALWEAQRAVRARLRPEFFAPYYGSSAARAAGILTNLLAEPLTDSGTIASTLPTGDPP